MDDFALSAGKLKLVVSKKHYRGVLYIVTETALGKQQCSCGKFFFL